MVTCRDAWWMAAIAGVSVGMASRMVRGGAGAVVGAAVGGALVLEVVVYGASGMFMLALMPTVWAPVAVPVWGRAFLSMPSWSGRASGAGNFIVREVF